MALSRVLVANRGEIAVRVVRACADEGLESVVALSAADMDSLPAHLADRAVCLGPAAAAESYLDVGRVVTAALGTGCDALHPGYGFLSERAELAEACGEHGVAFVGPDADTIRRGGDKIVARETARAAGIPVGAGSSAVADAAAAAAVAADVGYPVVLKAAAGGGGRGMKQVSAPRDIERAFTAASEEARQAFGDGRMYVERYVTNARHVEVQVLGDRHGNVVHLGERDCSPQRRYQKLVEEAPAHGLPDGLRKDLHDAALSLARELSYVGAGTVEFVVDVDRDAFAFLEVNTRVQVEHPVTELVTGIDIVREQLRIAAGEPLGFRQPDVTVRGHAVECRINAESPEAGFLPVPGRLTRWVVPQAADVRVDTHCYPGYLVPPYYDSMLAKLICSGADRAAALRRTTWALDRVKIEGVPTTSAFLSALVRHPDVVAGRVNTRWVEDVFLQQWQPDGGS